LAQSVEWDGKNDCDQAVGPGVDVIATRTVA